MNNIFCSSDITVGARPHLQQKLAVEQYEKSVYDFGYNKVHTRFMFECYFSQVILQSHVFPTRKLVLCARLILLQRILFINSLV